MPCVKNKLEAAFPTAKQGVYIYKEGSQYSHFDLHDFSLMWFTSF
jgi:hypothetical protein